jgi:hypothetical protein
MTMILFFYNNQNEMKRYRTQLEVFKKKCIQFPGYEKFAPKEPANARWKWPATIAPYVFPELGKHYRARLAGLLCWKLYAAGLLEKGGHSNRQYRLKKQK